MKAKFLFSLLTFSILLGAFGFGQRTKVIRAANLHDRYAYTPAIEAYRKVLEINPANEEAIIGLADCYRLTNNSFEAERWYRVVVDLPEAKIKHRFYYAQMIMQNGNHQKAAQVFADYLEEEPDDKVASNLLISCRDYNQFYQDSALYRLQNCNINSEKEDFSPTFYKDQVVFASARNKQNLVFNWNGRSFLELFTADYKGKMTLGDPKQVPGLINTKFHEATTTFTPDGNEMYFTRNNYDAGKIGKSDEGVILLKMYHAVLKGDEWSDFEEMRFNNDEYSVGHPALRSDGKILYFVSDMPGGIGGTDLYYCIRSADGWSDPINMGNIINTEANEMFPTITKNGRLHFSSNGHIGMGGLDIYEAVWADDTISSIKNIGAPINSSRDDFGLIMDTRRGVGFLSSNREGGMGDDDIYSFKRKHILEGIVVDKVTQEPIETADIELVESFKHNFYESDNTGRFEDGLYFNKDYSIIVNKKGYKEVKRVFSTKGKSLDETTAIKIEMVKEDDCIEKLQLAGNVFENGSPHLKKGMRVKIISEKLIKVDQEGMIFTSLLQGKDYTISVDDPDNQDKILELSTKGKTGIIPLDIELDRYNVNDVFFIIYYNFDRFNIRYDASEELDRVVHFMQKNATVGVQLSSHTDSRGSKDYNNRLSQSRAKEAYDYILSKGIAKDRLSMKWAGEEELANECADGVNCNEEGHQKNRRTVFSITKK